MEDDDYISEPVSYRIGYDEYGAADDNEDINENAEYPEEEDVEEKIKEQGEDLAVEISDEEIDAAIEEAIEEDEESEQDEEVDIEVDENDDSLETKIRSALGASKKASTSYYNVETGRVHTKGKKGNYVYYTLGDLRIAGTQDSDKITETLGELGYPNAKPDLPTLSYRDKSIAGFVTGPKLTAKGKERVQTRIIEKVGKGGRELEGEEDDVIPFAKGEKVPKGTKRVVRVQYVEKKVPLKLTEQQLKVATSVGLPIEVVKYVPVKVYADEPELPQVKKLLPDPVPRDPIGGAIQVIDIAEKRELIPGFFVPPQVAERINNPYDNRYYVGAYVSFKSRGPTQHRGIVLRADAKGFTLLNLSTFSTYTLNWTPAPQLVRSEEIPEEYFSEKDVIFINGESHPIKRGGGKNGIKPALIVDIIAFGDASSTMRGTVVGFTESAIDVNGEDGNAYLIPYDEKSLHIAKTQRVNKREKSIFGGGLTPASLYNEAVPTRLREGALSYLQDVVAMYVTPSKAKSEEEVKKVLSTTPEGLIGWDQYYKMQFMDWYYAREYDETRKVVLADADKLRKYAESEASALAESKATEALIANVDALLPNGLTATTTDDDLLQALLNKKDPSAFEATLRIQLEKRRAALGRIDLPPAPFSYPGEEGDALRARLQAIRAKRRVPQPVGGGDVINVIDQRRDISGRDLAIFLSSVFLLYGIRYPPPDVSVLYDRVVQDEISKRITARAEKLKPNDRVIRAFEASHLQDLRKRYDAVQAQAKSKAIPKKIQEEAKEIKERNLSLEVTLFEKSAYDTSEDVVTYLGKLFTPLVYLAPGAAATPYAKFFQAKLKTGEFRVSDFGQFNLAYYMPALVMSADVDIPGAKNVKDIAKAAKEAKLVLEYGISDLIDKYLWNYIYSIDPSARRSAPSVVPSPSVLKYFSDPRLVCAKNLAYVTTGYKPDLSKISYEDLIVCYDEGSDAFTCDSKRLILRNIALNKPNPYTDKPYSQAFVAMMKTRYPQLLEEMKTADVVDVVPKAVPKAAPKAVPKAQKVVAKAKRQRPVPRKRKGKPVLKNIALIGDALAEVINFNETLEYNTTNGPKSISISKSPSSSTQAVVVGVNVDDIQSIRSLNAPKGNEMYLLIISEKALSAKEKAPISRAIKNIEGGNNTQIIFADGDGDSEEKIIDALFDVVVDYEGVAVDLL